MYHVTENINHSHLSTILKAFFVCDVVCDVFYTFLLTSTDTAPTLTADGDGRPPPTL
jgi:hypothetical protein